MIVKSPLMERNATKSPSSSSRSILVLDADCNAATCVVQSLGRAGHKISLAGPSKTAFSFRSRFVQRSFFYPSPLGSRQSFLEWFKELISLEHFDYILPLSDVTLYPLRTFSPRIPGIVLPPDESFAWFFDKGKTLELARKVGVPVPKTHLFHSAGDVNLETLGSPPYFVKLTRSKLWIGDQGHDFEARLARNPRELGESVSSLTRFGPVLVQEYEPGDGVGIEMLCSQGRILIAFAHRRLHEYPLTGGGSTYRVSIPLPPALLEASERLVKEVGWTGVAMVEFKQNKKRFSLMEVNGRFWGSLPLSYRSGIDFPKALIEMIEGLHPTNERPSYRTGIYSRRFSTDFSWFKRNLVSDRKDPYLKTRPLRMTIFEYGRFMIGQDHWDHAYLSDPLPFLAEVGTTLKKTAWDIVSRTHGLLVRRVEPSRSRSRLIKLIKNAVPSKRPTNILVVCYGNICRSPFVEILLRKTLDPTKFVVRSCGIIKKDGRTSPEDYRLLTAQEGIDLSSHRSAVISRDGVAWADLIILMDFKNWTGLKSQAPDALGKVLWLGAWSRKGSGEIRDPYGKNREEMLEIISIMKNATLSFAQDLAGKERGRGL